MSEKILEKKLSEYKQIVDCALKDYFKTKKTVPVPLLQEAVTYSLFAGGKSLRAAICLMFYESYADRQPATDNCQPPSAVAAALECVHTFSLIHDDLPCMDDDDFRRGKPSCHKAFNEATAVLAGDALIICAFELLAHADIPCENKIKIIAEFCEHSGKDGMLAGQQADILFEKRLPQKQELIEMYKLKTCGLFKIAAKCGVILADKASELNCKNACDYAENLGLAFQIIDDILDVEGEQKTTGKPQGSDSASGKATAVSLFGLEQAREMAASYTKKALEHAKATPNPMLIVELTEELLNRKY
ncbi:MAG: polyprenyl synthetase family protein [Oscillospiraceae bacterium]|nr:polyprenyl synthetase family protein [Oscillospiraceae bacterium]